MDIKGSPHLNSPTPRCGSTPLFTNKFPLCGYFYEDSSGKGRRPVYCSISDRTFEFEIERHRELEAICFEDFDPVPTISDDVDPDVEII
jgi:hypothetical protein